MAALNSGISRPEGSRYSLARSRRGKSTANNIAFSKDSRLLAVYYERPRGHYMGLGREKGSCVPAQYFACLCA